MNWISINWTAVLSCAVIYLLVGGLWFGGGKNAIYRAWLRATAKPGDHVPGGELKRGVLWPLTVLSAIFQAVFMAVLVGWLTSTGLFRPSFGSGAIIGFTLWLGFVAPASMTNKLFAGQFQAWILETGNQLVDYVLMGAILGGWR